MQQSHPFQELYDKHITFRIESFWDGGFDVTLVDVLNGYMAKGNAKTLHEAVRWLVDHAEHHLGDVPDRQRLVDDIDKNERHAVPLPVASSYARRG